MPNDEVYRAVIGLRALRNYRSLPIAEDDLDAVLEAARWTGSSKNRQSWAFVAVSDPDQRRRLAECGDFTDPVRNAPLTLALVRQPDGYEFDIGRVAQTIMLAAATRGLASCPITLHRSADAGAVLGIPDGAEVRYAVAMGYPKDDAAPARFGGRKARDELVHTDRWNPGD
jgi:nitroreductase